MSQSTTQITIPDMSCNDNTITQLDFSPYFEVRTITIGFSSYGFVNDVVIDGLEKVESITVGLGSFFSSSLELKSLFYRMR